MLNKSQLIGSIQEINRSVKADWLEMFDISALRNYLNNLQHTLEPRGRDSHWTRLGDTPPFIVHYSRS